MVNLRNVTESQDLAILEQEHPDLAGLLAIYPSEMGHLLLNNKDKFLPTEKSDQRYMVDLKKTFATENAQQMSDSVTDIIKGQEGKMTSDRLATVIEAADKAMYTDKQMLT